MRPPLKGIQMYSQQMGCDLENHYQERLPVSWKSVLSEDDYRFYKENISLLEERVVGNFADSYRAPGILSAIRRVPRHLFVGRDYRSLAYTDNALPTTAGLTTSAPSVIATMILHAGVSSGRKVLEIGTGPGYQAAILAEMGAKVWSIEIDRSASQKAGRALVELGYKIDKQAATRDRESMKRYQAISRMFPERGQVELFWGNGQNGLANKSPFHAIIVAVSVPYLRLVSRLPAQLSESGGRMVVPVGDRHRQTLYIVKRNRNRIESSVLEGVSFDFLSMIPKQER